MNKKRRTVLHRTIDKLETLSGTETLDDALAILKEVSATLEDCEFDEQASYDCLPESFQTSTRGEDMEENISNLCDARCDIDAVIDECEADKAFILDKHRQDIENVINNINDAITR